MSPSKQVTLLLLCFALSLKAALLLPACKRGGEETESRESPKTIPREVDTAPPPPLSHDDEPPPPPPTGRPVTAYKDGKAEEMREPQALKLGLTVVDLSNYWTPYIFSERDSDAEERKPNEFRSIYRKLANDWRYESRTKAAAREIVERQIVRSKRNRIFRLRQEGTAEEEIRKIMGMSEEEVLKIMGKTDSTEKDSDASNDEAEKTKETGGAGDANKEDEDDFEGGLGDADNYLEVYGIPPTLSVLKKRVEEEIDRPCFDEVDMAAIQAFDGFIAYKNNKQAREDSRNGRRLKRKLESEMKRLGVETIADLQAHPKNKLSNSAIEQLVQYNALSEAQKLLVCEGLYAKGREKDYWGGGLDWKTHQALLAFEHKNRIFGWGFFGKDTLDALRKTPKERLFDAFVRVLQERLIDAGRFIEDGSTKDQNGEPATYKDASGEKKPVPNLVAEFTTAALHHMDLKTPDKVVNFLKAHDEDALNTLFVALPLPELPPYYADIMTLRAEIDRGDVWYDYPYTEEGRHRTFPRARMPMLTLFVRWNDQDIPLVTMNTTIGGWRTELAPDGYEYYKYKNSDVGPRVWRDIVAGPVWLPPDTTPASDLLKEVRFRGRRLKVPNYDEFGPWYASAYGLVAAFHVREVQRKNGVAYFDNGIRSHGSVDYNSILRRFSHGCHRLYNHLAIRLFDFVLRHSEFERVGQIPAGYSKEVVIEEEEGEERYIIDINSKGYKYELKNPVPMNVLSGNIRGRQKTPIETYMPKPEETYGVDAQFLPEGYWEKHNPDGGVPTPTAADLAAGAAAPTAVPAPAQPAPPASPTLPKPAAAP